MLFSFDFVHIIIVSVEASEFQVEYENACLYSVICCSIIEGRPELNFYYRRLELLVYYNRVLGLFASFRLTMFFDFLFFVSSVYYACSNISVVPPYEECFRVKQNFKPVGVSLCMSFQMISAFRHWDSITLTRWWTVCHVEYMLLLFLVLSLPVHCS